MCMISQMANTISSTVIILAVISVQLIILGRAVNSASDHPTSSSSSSSVNVEAQALLAFKNGITADPLGRLASWTLTNASSSSSAHPACTGAWSGIVCDAQKRHVTSVNLASSKLSGTFISSSLSLLPALSDFNLSDNSLFGGFPSSLFLHGALQVLDLSRNLLSGPLPDSLAVAANTSARLTVLDLSFNYFSGEIPSSTLAQLCGGDSSSLANASAALLTVLDLSYNGFVGEIPSSLGTQCKGLERLYLAEAGKLTGRIPAEVWQLPALIELEIVGDFNSLLEAVLPDKFASCPTIRFLKLMMVQAATSSVFPSSLGDCKGLQRLYLIDTGLTGRIPAEVWQLPALIELAIFNWEGNSLLEAVLPDKFASCPTITVLELGIVKATSSSFPSSLGDCRQLQVLHLEVIGLEGFIPPELWQLPLLQTLVVVTSFIDASDPGHPPPFKLHGSLPSSFRCCQTITELIIDGVNLTGEIPPSLGQCTALQSLALSHGSLEGAIPQTLGNLSNLQTLSLEGNKLTGTIPKLHVQGSSGHNRLEGEIPIGLGALANLQVLDLSNNRLEGEIPIGLGALANLQTLDLSNNMLWGPVPIKSLENCTALQYLRLYNNTLTGTIEQFDLSKLQSLTTFTVRENNFIGGLPRGLTSSKNLQLFDVQGNGLSGTLPGASSAWDSIHDDGAVTITGLKKLRVLVMSHNQLSGEIPGWVWELPMLQVLDLSSNHFNGSMPGTVTHLNYFKRDQSHNSNQTKLYEEVPQTIKGTFQVLPYILNTRIFFDISMNSLQGQIAESFGELLGLTGLNLSHNHIQGEIPSSLGKLAHLDELDLSHNNLTGRIPAELGDLGGLSQVDLSYNHLQGPIPTTNNFNTRFNYSIFEGNPGLCGAPLPSCSHNSTNTESTPDAWSLIAWIESFASPWALLIAYPVGLFGGLYFLHQFHRWPMFSKFVGRCARLASRA